jgi:hypothetical protein
VTIKTYNASTVTLTFNGKPITGYADGGMVTYAGKHQCRAEWPLSPNAPHEGKVSYGQFWMIGMRWGTPDYCCDGHGHEILAQDPGRRRFEHLEPPDVRSLPLRHITYCENAPPREVVESLVVRVGSGLEGGKPVMAPTVYTYAMRREWERHGAFDKDRGYANLMHLEREVPRTGAQADKYGGKPIWSGDYRCRLCGGWMRVVELTG